MEKNIEKQSTPSLWSFSVLAGATTVWQNVKSLLSLHPGHVGFFSHADGSTSTKNMCPCSGEEIKVQHWQWCVIFFRSGNARTKNREDRLLSGAVGVDNSSTSLGTIVHCAKLCAMCESRFLRLKCGADLKATFAWDDRTFLYPSDSPRSCLASSPVVSPVSLICPSIDFPQRSSSERKVRKWHCRAFVFSEMANTLSLYSSNVQITTLQTALQKWLTSVVLSVCQPARSFDSLIH